MKNYFVFLFCLLFALSGCKQKNREQQLISEVEHFDIDTVKAKEVDIHPVTHADSLRAKADVVLRRYPEMYHATDLMQKCYRKWAEEETKYLTLVFVGKDKVHEREYQKHKRKFETRLEQLNFIEPLCAILCDETSPSLSDVSTKLQLDDKAFENIYHLVMFSIKEGLKSNENGYSTDEMRTACQKAFKSWQQYIGCLPELLKTMPDDTAPKMEKAMLRIRFLHYIDLMDFYIPYWSNVSRNTPLVLKDNSTDEQINNVPDAALHMCSWMEVKK